MKTLLALLVLSALAVAGTVVSFQFTTLTDFTQPLDPLTLSPKEQAASIAVRVCGRAMYRGNVAAENEGANATVVSVGLSPEPIVFSVGGIVVHTISNPQQTRVWAFDVYDGTTDFDGPSGGMHTFPATMSLYEFDVVDPVPLGLLLGGEPLRISMRNTSFASGAGNLTFLAGSEVSAQGTVENIVRPLP